MKKNIAFLSSPTAPYLTDVYDEDGCSGGAVGKSVWQARGRLGVRIPAATDLSR